MRIAPIAIALLLLAVTPHVNASIQSPKDVAVVEQSKVAVRPEDLPEPVKSTLASSYSEWKVTSAYLVTRDDNSQYYEINIKRAEETSTLNLDKYGKKVD
ncbi:hypothetical protein GCM10010967_34050 [Dyadobacter beijingensis]|uniref:PepSY domain-containing protein n=1 Tax=Dyadobacter beijingensis TaxID=365489 RepID=A0ABQ2I3Q8_9BACT|nr:hypothetical protein [Dyadobacter beijingensis]GGM97460.1 hypothetical protein GCM10010967_34050 [Dyadobacter beijingensis]